MCTLKQDMYLAQNKTEAHWLSAGGNLRDLHSTLSESGIKFSCLISCRAYHAMTGGVAKSLIIKARVKGSLKSCRLSDLYDQVICLTFLSQASVVLLCIRFR